ncbi:hypothetical protein AB6A40_005970 [Gnathostoma spinigerum]|uniref:Proline dehydrogenase n=1 Tax=Gnathostoma spinigerum TaxID=75299 RepID=A0ABD6EJ28_9BILA
MRIAIFRKILLQTNTLHSETLKKRLLSNVVLKECKVDSNSKSRNSVGNTVHRVDLSFENAQEAFKSKSNFELLRGIIVLRLCSLDFLVKNNASIMMVLRKVLGQSLFKKLLKSTFYGHFVAGESSAEVETTIVKLQAFGVKSILDYSVESDINEEDVRRSTIGRMSRNLHVDPVASVVDKKIVERTQERYTAHDEFADRRQEVVGARTYFYGGESQCDQNRDIFCECIDAVAKSGNGQGFIAIKITALGRPQVLLKMSESIALNQNFYRALTGSSWETLVLSRFDEQDFLQKLKDFGVKTDSKMVQEWLSRIHFNQGGFVDFYDWTNLFDESDKFGQMFQIYNLKTQRMESLINSLDEEDTREVANMLKRITDVTEHAISRGVRVMVDAEQTYFQPATSRIALTLMRRYNKEEGNVLNTYQAYLKNALRNLEMDLHVARREDFHFGLKLVRGAYMEQERKRAEAIGYEDPINPTFEKTNEMYRRIMRRVLEEGEIRGKHKVSVMIASHNEDSVRDAVLLMDEKRVKPDERVVCFAHLYGMADQISFSLGQAGYSVYKYLPYGPVEDVLPYLARRAQENNSIMKVDKEVRLLWKELKRRILNGEILYKVPLSA